jgi:predicted membrane-bound spermidine synthase
MLLIPMLGVRDTFVVVGAALLAVSAVGFRRGPSAAVPPAAALGLLLVPHGLVRPMEGLVWEGESLYHFIQVVEAPYGKCPDALHLYLNEGVGIHSVKCPSRDDYDIRGVWNYMAATPLYLDDRESPMEVLIVGLAGGTIARQLLQAYPNAHIDGVEIDRAVVEVGERWFDDDDPRITRIVMDGRIFLQLTDKKYDLVVMDAYRQPYIPFHLVTTEFFGLVADHLTEDGVLAVNVASVRGVSKSLARMIYRTMRETFPMVTLISATKANDVIVATRRAKDPLVAADRLEALPENERLIGLNRIRGQLRSKIVGEVEGWEDARLLTDDQAPVELAWDLMALEYAR